MYETTTNQLPPGVCVNSWCWPATTGPPNNQLHEFVAAVIRLSDRFKTAAMRGNNYEMRVGIVGNCFDKSWLRYYGHSTKAFAQPPVPPTLRMSIVVFFCRPKRFPKLFCLVCIDIYFPLRFLLYIGKADDISTDGKFKLKCYYNASINYPKQCGKVKLLVTVRSYN